MTEPSITLTGDSAVALLEAKKKWLGRTYQPGDLLLNRVLAGIPEPEPADPAVELWEAIKLAYGDAATSAEGLVAAVALIRTDLDKARAEGAASAVPDDVRVAGEHLRSGCIYATHDLRGAQIIRDLSPTPCSNAG